MSGSVSYCSFCAKANDQVAGMIAGPALVFICSECISLCVEILINRKISEVLKHAEPAASKDGEGA